MEYFLIIIIILLLYCCLMVVLSDHPINALLFLIGSFIAVVAAYQAYNRVVRQGG